MGDGLGLRLDGVLMGVTWFLVWVDDGLMGWMGWMGDTDRHGMGDGVRVIVLVGG